MSCCPKFNIKSKAFFPPPPSINQDTPPERIASYLEILIYGAEDIQADSFLKRDVLIFLSDENLSFLYEAPTIKERIHAILTRVNLVNYVDAQGTEDIFSFLKFNSPLRDAIPNVPMDRSQAKVTPLHLTAYLGDLKGVIKSLSSGINPNARTLRGETALHLACEKGCFAIAKLLLTNKEKYGIDPFALTPKGTSPFHYAYHKAHRKIVSLYLIPENSMDFLLFKVFYLLNQPSYERINFEILQFLINQRPMEFASVESFFEIFAKHLLILDTTKNIPSFEESNYTPYLEVLESRTLFLLNKLHIFMHLMETELGGYQMNIECTDDISQLTRIENSASAYISYLKYTTFFKPEAQFLMKQKLEKLHGLYLQWNLLKDRIVTRKTEITSPNQKN